MTDWLDPDRHRLALPRNDEDPYQIGPSDTERLNWLEQTESRPCYGIDCHDESCGCIVTYCWLADPDGLPITSECGSLREAIDEAMRAQPGA